MLHIIAEINDQLRCLIRDDPVRPELPAEFRVNQHSRVFVLKDDHSEQIRAVTCVKFLSDIPATVTELAAHTGEGTTAVFYTIWSYASGAGRELIQQAQQHIKNTNTAVTTFVTLSPKTEMARRFHHSNGATTYRENADTVNYVYK